MLIIPVLYILDGRCVALYKGSFEQKEQYFKNPVDMARVFERDGAPLLYVVDLNAKKAGGLVQEKIIEQIIHSVKIPVWLEADFNNLALIQKALDMGGKKVVLVSPNIEFLSEMLERFDSSHFIIQILAKQAVLIEPSKLSPQTLLPSYTQTDVVDYAERLIPLGIKEIIYKDQSSEGTLIHPDYDEVDRLILTLGTNVDIYVSGGIGDIKHLKLLKKIGTSGALIGKAFYEKNIALSSAIEALKD